MVIERVGGAARRSVSSAAYAVSSVANNIALHSWERKGPVAHLTIAYRAGSRYEGSDEAGFAHRIRNSFGLDSKNYSSISLLWETAARGGSLRATATADLLAVHLSLPREHASFGLSILGELAQPALKAWEVADHSPTLHEDIRNQTAYDHVIQLLHKAAYRSGSLGNPVISSPHAVDNQSFQKLSKYAAARLVASEAAVVAINVDDGVLGSWATRQGSIPAGSKGRPLPSPYKGGEERRSVPGKLAHLAVAGEGSGYADSKALATLYVLAQLIGGGPITKYPNNSGPGVVARAVVKATGGFPVGVNALVETHSDSSLIGFYLTASEGVAPVALKAAVDALKSLSSSVDATALSAARRLAYLNHVKRAENSFLLGLDSAAQLLAEATLPSIEDTVGLINSVTVDDIKKAAGKVTSRLSFAAYGSIEKTPYADELRV